MTTYNLDCRFDSHKSFYGKAVVAIADDGTMTLYSYGTPVVKKRGNKVTLGDAFDYSATTLRHCREALKQWGYPTYSKKDMRKYYTVEHM